MDGKGRIREVDHTGTDAPTASNDPVKYPSWRCPHCGEPIGWLGRVMEFIFGDLHECDRYD
jgi:hypothetical protein